MQIDSKEVINEIKTKFSALTTILDDFSEEEFNQVPLKGSWTVGQVAEHLIKSMSGIPDKETTSADRPYNEKVVPIKEMFLNMDVKFKTDPLLEPNKPPHQKFELINTLSELENYYLSLVQKIDLTALCLDNELPTFGYLTRYEWIRFMLLHMQRHTIQIKNIGLSLVWFIQFFKSKKPRFVLHVK